MSHSAANLVVLQLEQAQAALHRLRTEAAAVARQLLEVRDALWLDQKVQREKLEKAATKLLDAVEHDS